MAASKWSLRKRLALGLVLTALLPVLLFSVAMLWSQWQRDSNDLMLRLDANARLSASLIDEFLESQQAGVRLLADQVADDQVVSGEELSRLLKIYPSMLRALHVDAHGRVVIMRDTRLREQPQVVVDVSAEDWFKVNHNQFRAYISDAYQRPIYGSEVVVAVSAPLLRQDRFEGVLQAAIPVESIARLSAESLARRNFELLLLDRSNRVVYAGAGLRWKSLDDAGRQGMALREMALAADHSGRVELRRDLLREPGDTYVEAVAMRNQWTLALVAPREILLAPLRPRLLLLFALLAVTLLGMVWALWLQRQMLRHNIGYLLASLHGYALGGKLDSALRSRLPEELQPLADGIGELGGRMNNAFEELNQVLGEREAVIEERTESLRQAVQKLELISRTDAMTGCLNYRGFVEEGERLWQQFKISGTPLAVLALDIDFFKRYNDHYGHLAGDSALRRFAGAVRSALLHADDVLARPGGEEFTVFLPGSTIEQALQVGERVRLRVFDADIAHAKAPSGRLTVSVGVAVCQTGDRDIEALLHRADAALYRAKAAGRNGVSA
ncbi:diguanylate cyclase [Thermomonas sp.]|uniref:diguanylate cyclase n=1 Tax=Thermomonas sp. TaxID=1971895 RepID=UPI002CE58AA7|nr:diguanylate cyclase [Thermomonas sp.]HQA02886.1 diguanylate cyclase [Thermomonas sp.]